MVLVSPYTAPGLFVAGLFTAAIGAIMYANHCIEERQGRYL
jgi:hypothetical protein